MKSINYQAINRIMVEDLCFKEIEVDKKDE
jgi:hypothetical protein